MNGIIIKGIGGFYYVKTDDGALYECRAKGKFRKEHILPMIGDYVDIEVLKNGRGNVSDILPRRTSLIRPAVANIDTLVLVAAVKSPDPDFMLIDKMLITAEKNNITPVICVNKSDLGDGCELGDIYSKAGYEVFVCSAEHGDGIEELKTRLRDHVTAFAGLSGVGKSTILTSVTGRGLETGSVSEKIQRGRHTTRHVELLELDGGGFVLDTPGFSSFELEGITAQELGMYFPEIARLENMCRFRGCAHVSEPECGVKDAVENGEISRTRYENYKQLYTQLKDIKRWQE